MRDKKQKEIVLEKDSMLGLLQEVYHEIDEQRNTALRIQNKMISMMRDPEDMTLIGPVVEKQQKIINDCVDKKLQLIKLQSNIWDKATKKPETFSVSDINFDDDTIKDLLESSFNSEDKYKLKKK
jgi:hypothetical protein